MKLNKLFKYFWKYRHIWGPIVIDVVKPIIRKFINKHKNKKDGKSRN